MYKYIILSYMLINTALAQVNCGFSDGANAYSNEYAWLTYSISCQYNHDDVLPSTMNSTQKAYVQQRLESIKQRSEFTKYKDLGALQADEAAIKASCRPYQPNQNSAFYCLRNYSKTADRQTCFDYCSGYLNASLQEVKDELGKVEKDIQQQTQNGTIALPQQSTLYNQQKALLSIQDAFSLRLQVLTTNRFGENGNRIDLNRFRPGNPHGYSLFEDSTNARSDRNIMNRLIRLMLQIIPTIAIFLTIYNGFQYMLASLGGSNKGDTSGLQNALIGMVIAFMSYMIVQFILSVLFKSVSFM